MSNTNPRFTPHALIVTERSVPEPMFVAAFIGVERLLRVDLDASAPPLTFAGQALRAVRRRLAGLALPTEALELHKFSTLRISLGRECSIDSQHVPPSRPKPLRHRARRPSPSIGPCPNQKMSWNLG